MDSLNVLIRKNVSPIISFCYRYTIEAERFLSLHFQSTWNMKVNVSNHSFITACRKQKNKAWLLAIDVLIDLLNTNRLRCYIRMYVSFSSHFTVNWNPWARMTNTVHYQLMMIWDHRFQNGMASANCSLPSSENLICKMVFFFKKRISKISGIPEKMKPSKLKKQLGQEIIEWSLKCLYPS